MQKHVLPFLKEETPSAVSVAPPFRSAAPRAQRKGQGVVPTVAAHVPAVLLTYQWSPGSLFSCGKHGEVAPHAAAFPSVSTAEAAVSPSGANAECPATSAPSASSTPITAPSPPASAPAFLRSSLAHVPIHMATDGSFRGDAATRVQQRRERAGSPAAQLGIAGDSVCGCGSEYQGSVSNSEACPRNAAGDRSNCGTGGTSVRNSSASDGSGSNNRRPCSSTNRSEDNTNPNVSSSMSSCRSGATTSLPSEETRAARKQPSTPRRDVRSTNEVRHFPKRPPLFTAVMIHGKESPAYSPHVGSRLSHSRNAAGPAADAATDPTADAATAPSGSSDVFASPAVVASSADASGGVDNGGSTPAERQVAAASACAPLLREENVPARPEPVSRHFAAASSAAEFTAGASPDRREKRLIAGTEAELLTGRSPRPAAAGHASQSPAAPPQGRPGLTPLAAGTPELDAFERRLGVTSSDSFDLNSVSYGITPSLLYEGSNEAEGATPATSLLQHFTHKQEQHRPSLTKALRRRCSDAAAVFRRGSVPSRRESAAGPVMQPQPPHQQHPLAHVQQEVRQLTPEGYSLSELARGMQRPTEEQGELKGAGKWYGGGAWQEQQQQVSGKQGRRSREGGAASRSSEAKEGPARTRRGTGASSRWKELALRRDQLLSRYSDHTENSGRERGGDNNRSSGRSESRGDSWYDSRKGEQGQILPPQQQFHLNGRNGASPVSAANAAADAAGEASVAEVDMKGKRASTVSKESQNEVAERRRAPVSADGGQQRMKGTPHQSVSYPEFHVEVPLTKDGQQPGEDSIALYRTAGPTSLKEALGVTPLEKDSSRSKEQPQAHLMPASQEHRGSRVVPTAFLVQTGSQRSSAGLESTAGRARYGVQQRGLNETAREQYRQQLQISGSGELAAQNKLLRPFAATAATARNAPASGSHFSVEPPAGKRQQSTANNVSVLLAAHPRATAASPPLAAVSRAAVVPVEVSAARHASPLDHPADASGGGTDAAGYALDARLQEQQGTEEAEDALQDAQVRGLPLRERVRAAAADARAAQGETRSLLNWFRRRRPAHANHETLVDELGGGDAERAKVQVANAAEELPPPHTTLLLPLPEQRARRLRTHVVIEIRDGSHRILEVQVAEVLRMLEQQCEEDEQQQLLLRQERRQRRAGRRRARLRRHRRNSSGTRNSSDDSSRSGPDWAEELTSETPTVSSFFPVVNRHKKERVSRRRADEMSKKCGNRKQVPTRRSKSSSSLLSVHDHLRCKVAANALFSSCGSTSALLPASAEGTATQSASSGSSVPSRSSCTTVDGRTAAARGRVCCHAAAAAAPYTTRRRKGPSPFGRKDNDFRAGVGTGDTRAILPVPGGRQADPADLLLRKHLGREETARPGRQVRRDCAPVDAEDAAGAESLLHGLKIKDTLSSTNATSVTVAAAWSSGDHTENREKQRCVGAACRHSSGGNDVECRTSDGNGILRKWGSRESAACCGDPRCCSGVGRSSSSSSQSSDTHGHVDSSKGASAVVSSTQANDLGQDSAKEGIRKRFSKEKAPDETSMGPGFVAEVGKGDWHGSRSRMKKRRIHTRNPRWSAACFSCGMRLPAAARGGCVFCCRPCCCCNMCCCERCGGGVGRHAQRERRRAAGIRANVRASSLSTSSLSSLCAAVERQHRHMLLLQHQRQQQWQLQRQQAAMRSKGKGGADTGRLTYRDCRQAFTDVHPIPSIEVRRHVVLVCLPPVTCFVLWDRVLLLMTDDLEPDHLISQLSKLTRQYAVIERKGRASSTVGTGSPSQRDRQLEEPEQQQQRGNEGPQPDGTSYSLLQRPREEMWLQPEAPLSPRGSFPVSSIERRLLQDHVYHEPSLHLPGGLKYQQQLRHYQQLSEPQGQLPQRQDGREVEHQPSLRRGGRRLRPCYSSEDAPEELLEEVEEAAAVAREKAALSLQAASRSCTPHDKRQGVGSLSCPFVVPSNESDPPPRIPAAAAAEQLRQQQRYDLHMPEQSPQTDTTAWGGKATAVVPDQQPDLVEDGSDCSHSLLFEDAGKVAAAPVSFSRPLHLVNNCGIRKELKGRHPPIAVESFVSLQEKRHTNSEGPSGQGARMEAPFCTVKQEARMQTTPLCGAAVPAAFVASASPPSLLRTSPPTASSEQQQQMQEAAAAATPGGAHAPPTPRPSIVAATATAPAPGSEAPLRPLPGEQGNSAAGPWPSLQLAPEQHLRAEHRSLQIHQGNKKEQQQGDPDQAGQQHGVNGAFVDEALGEHVCEQQQRANTETNVTAYSGKSAGDTGGRGHRTHQQQGQARGWYNGDSQEKRTFTRAASSSETRSRRPSRRSERRKGAPLGKRTMPFEFAALECIFFAAFQQLNFDIVYLEKKFAETHHRAAKKSEASSILLEGLHSLKEPVALYEDRVTAFDKAFDELLSNNVDLHRMELTRLHYNPGLYDFDPHKDEVDPELEILLEYFDQEMDQFKDRVRHLKQGIDNTERLISLRLALMRNRLIQWELAAAVVAAGIAIGTCISGIFGMNLANGYEDGKERSHEMFTIVSAVITVLAVGSVVVVLYLIRTIVL